MFQSIPGVEGLSHDYKWQSSLLNKETIMCYGTEAQNPRRKGGIARHACSFSKVKKGDQWDVGEVRSHRTL